MTLSKDIAILEEKAGKLDEIMKRGYEFSKNCLEAKENLKKEFDACQEIHRNAEKMHKSAEERWNKAFKDYELKLKGVIGEIDPVAVQKEPRKRGKFDFNTLSEEINIQIQAKKIRVTMPWLEEQYPQMDYQQRNRIINLLKKKADVKMHKEGRMLVLTKRED